MKKIFIILIFSVFLFSCNNEDDCHETATFVLLSAQIVDSNGDNLFNDENFDISLLEIMTVSDNPEEILFNRLGDFIVFEFYEKIMINYNGENKAEITFSNISSEVNDCGAFTSFNYTAESNSEIICECDIDDVLTIRFDI